ncbi:hypothetical protein C8J56DRAFT_897487 [Mycena floridula]|nr:hypothetical protein C8J56DRAFT_897487 [Mycena floridula]
MSNETPQVKLTKRNDGTNAEGKEHFKKYLELLSSIVVKTEEIPYEKVGTLQQGNFKPGPSVYTTSTTIPLLSSANTAKAVGAMIDLATRPSCNLSWPTRCSTSGKSWRCLYMRQLSKAMVFVWEGVSEQKQKLASDVAKKFIDILHEGSSSLTPISDRLDMPRPMETRLSEMVL